MSTANTPAPVKQQQGEALASLRPPRLPYHPAIQERFGIDRAGWKALVEAIFPNAQTPDSVCLALAYCQSRKLDPFKRCVHIVPIWSKQLRCMVDTVWPGIGELRTTAFRTGEYAGRDATVFGPDITRDLGGVELTFPEFAQVTVRRLLGDRVVEFAGPRVYWVESYATAGKDTEAPNEMWRDRPRGQIDKCAEAAALRAGFPEEIGSDYIPEEVERGSRPGSTVLEHEPQQAPPKGLDELTVRLGGGSEKTAEEAPPETAQEDAQPEPAGDPLDGVGTAFEDAESLQVAQRIYDSLCGPESVLALNEEQRLAVEALWAKAQARLAKAAKKGK